MCLLPCCGRPVDYCECPDWYSFRSLMLASNERDNDTPRMADDDPRRDDAPPF
jgi:hypothetical protein